MSASGLTVEKLSRAHKLMKGAARTDGRRLSPADFRDIILVSVAIGVTDHWEAWKQLYNAGFRGRLLNDFSYLA